MALNSDTKRKRVVSSVVHVRFTAVRTSAESGIKTRETPFGHGHELLST